MKVTQKSVLVKHSARRPGWDAYEQGAIHGRVVAYPIDEACRILGMTVEELARADCNDYVPGYLSGITIAEALDMHLGPGRVIRRGRKFE